MVKSRTIYGRGFVGVRQIDRKAGYGRPHDLEGHKKITIIAKDCLAKFKRKHGFKFKEVLQKNRSI